MVHKDRPSARPGKVARPSVALIAHTAHTAHIALVALSAMAGVSHAHDLQHHVEAGPPVRVHFFFPDDSRFSFENFEIRAPGDSMLFQKGRTDALGRVVLAPHLPGTWRVRVYSDDGHGADVDVEVDAAGTLNAYSRSLFDRYSRAFSGAALLLGAFGLFNLFNSLRKRERKP